jgi:pimeloyl-ACP methyl ester carboxylesterase
MAKKHLVFLHGFLEDHTMWKPLLPMLSLRNYHVHFPTLPGHSDEQPLAPSSSTSDYVDAVLSQLPISPDNKVFVIGHSMGGYLASHVVQRIHAQVCGLLLFHSKAGADSEEKINDRKRAIAAAQENKNLYVRGMITGCYAPSLREQLQTEMEAHIAFAQTLSAETIAASQQFMIQREDALDFMKHRHFPLYYFLGKKDASIPLEVAQAELAQLPGAMAHVSEDAAHMGHLESTREAADFIQRILRAEG